MLGFLGLRVYYFRPLGYGVFHCQRCGGDRGYRHRSGRRWFQLCRIPLIPLARTGEHVQCIVCRTAYRVELLAVPTSAQMLAALPAGTRAAAVAMLRAGDPVGPAARNRAIGLIGRAGLTGYDDAALAAELARPPAPDRDVAGPVATLAVQLETAAREWFLADMVRIGLADGPLTAPERHTAAVIAGWLGMTSAQAAGVITVTEESARAE